MRGALLRSGKSGAFTALGETGQPVYRAALQLREAIRRKNPDMAMHLAIPQSDELGDNIDWYSDVPGDVVPWGSATEEERAPARAQLEVFKAFLAELSTTLLSADGNKAQSDKVVFAKLLTRVISFPDESFVYLVNGKPVLAFWGFVHPNADRFLDPLYCLYPRTEVPVAPPLVHVAPEPAPAPQPVPVVVNRPWWKWLLWLLLLLLLLFLLFFGLRSCSPSVALPTGATLSSQWPNFEMPQAFKSLKDQFGFGNGVSVPGNGKGDESRPATEAGSNEPASGPTTHPDGNNLPPELPDANTPPVSEPAVIPEPAPPEPPLPTKQPPEPAPTPAPAPPTLPGVPGPALSIPPEAADGQADFLNGRFRAGAGIQDKTTGQSLRLEYQFKDGKGEVVVRKPGGINCTGPVTASMNGGNLSINSQGQAVCGDGSSYEMPKVDCRQGAKSIADCNGIYEDKQFPISMRQMGE